MKWQYLVKVFAQLAEFHGYTSIRPLAAPAKATQTEVQQLTKNQQCCAKFPAHKTNN